MFSVCLCQRLEHIQLVFRFHHMMIRSNCEAAAFYRCGRLEWKNANNKLKDLSLVQQKVNGRRYVFNCMNCFTYLVTHLLQWVTSLFDLDFCWDFFWGTLYVEI